MKKKSLGIILLSAIAPGLLATAPVQALPISAKDILATIPAATDGVYTIDTDGAGPKGSIQVYADMTAFGGGWTLGLASFRGSVALTTDLTVNTGTAGFNSAHTRDLSELALNSDTQIRHQVIRGGVVLFDGYYTDSYHGILEANPGNWTIGTGTITGFGTHQLGKDWSTTANDVDDWSGNCATLYGPPGVDSPWYYGSCWTSHPAVYSGGSPGQGPHWTGPVDSWRIYVREGASVSGSTPASEPSVVALLALGVAGMRCRRRRTA